MGINIRYPNPCWCVDFCAILCCCSLKDKKMLCVCSIWRFCSWVSVALNNQVVYFQQCLSPRGRLNLKFYPSVQMICTLMEFLHMWMHSQLTLASLERTDWFDKTAHACYCGIWVYNFWSVKNQWGLVSCSMELGSVASDFQCQIQYSKFH